MDELIGLLKEQQRRHNKKEKKDFIEFLKNQLISNGYNYEIIKTRLFQTEHVASKSDHDPTVVFLAHYDTSTILPIWVEWLLKVFGHTRNILTLLLLILIFYFVEMIKYEFIVNIINILLLGSLFIPMIMFANKNTMNDNTSGVLVLLLLLNRIAQSEDLKKKVKFVFTDNEEKMLVGSFQLKKIWKRQGFNYGNRIVSIDSIGRGENLIISYNFVSKLSNELKDFFKNRGFKVQKTNMFCMPFSDAYSFWRSGAVNLNMMNKSIIPGGYYIKDIHSKRDKIIEMENISKLVETLEEYVKNVCQQTV